MDPLTEKLMTAKTVSMFVGVVMLIGLSSAVAGQHASAATDVAGKVVADEMAATVPAGSEFQGEERDRQTGDLRTVPIKSQLDLTQYIQNHPGSPLDRLSPPAKQRFISSVTFNETGLTGFDYSDLRAELTASQIDQILSLFGAQRLTHMVHGANAATANDQIPQALPSPPDGD